MQNGEKLPLIAIVNFRKSLRLSNNSSRTQVILAVKLQPNKNIEVSRY